MPRLRQLSGFLGWGPMSVWGKNSVSSPAQAPTALYTVHQGLRGWQGGTRGARKGLRSQFCHSMLPVAPLRSAHSALELGFRPPVGSIFREMLSAVGRVASP